VVSTPLQAAAQAAQHEFAYTANFADKTISGFSVDPGTGKATEVPGSPFPSGTGPISITHSPDGRFVYEVINNQDLGGPCGGPGELISFGVDPRTGALSQIDDVFLSGICSTGVTIDPTGKFVYAASSPDSGPKVGIIDGFQTSNGHLTPLPGTPFASPIEAPDGQGPSIEEIAITPDGKVAYVSDPNDATGILIFDRDTQTGALAFRTAFNSGSPFGAIAITPSGKFLIALGGGSFGFPFTGQPGVFEFAIGEHGDLTPAPGSPFPLPHDFGSSVAIFPDGNFVAVVGAFSAITGPGISVFRESAQGTLSLVPGSPFGDVTAGAISFDPTGRFVLVPGGVYKIDSSTGALSKASEFTPGGLPMGYDPGPNLRRSLQ
jgi:DNA-binding beta-propeller fold protein YncE